MNKFDSLSSATKLTIGLVLCLFAGSGALGSDQVKPARAGLNQTEAGPVQAQILYKEAQKLIQTKNYPQALSKLEEAARLGNLDAMRETGIFLEDGTAGNEDLKQAEYWFRKAVASNDPESMYRLAGIVGIRNNTETKEVMDLVKRAADLGHRDAQRKISIAYYSGKGVPRDLQKAFKYRCMAAAQGEPKSAYKAGIQLMAGEGIKRDYGEAARLFKISAKHKPEAANKLAEIYSSGGPGLKADPVQAAYYRKLFREMTRSSNEDTKGLIQSLDRD